MASNPMHDNDPLWKLRHALAGVGLALLFSVPLSALLGSTLGDALGGSYGWRAGVYAALLIYVVVGAGVLFVKVARHETRALSLPRLGVWIASLWLWPLLLAASRKTPPPTP
jgi:MFS family permease